MTTDLKPCWCGAKAHTVEVNDYFVVCCTDAAHRSKPYTSGNTREGTIRAWNFMVGDLDHETKASTDRLLNSLAAIDGKDLEAKQLVQMVTDCHGIDSTKKSLDK